MSTALHLIQGSDFTVRDVRRLGMESWFRTLFAAYRKEFTVEYYTIDCEDYSESLGVRHHPLGPRWNCPRPVRWLVYSLGLIRRAAHMRGIVRCFGANVGVLPEIRRLSGSPILVDFHYDWAETSRSHYGGIKRRWARPVQRRCLGAADLVICTTHDLARKVRTRPPRRAIVIPNFVDATLFHPGTPREPTVLFAGRLHWAKGIDVLIEAFLRVAPRRPEATLLLFGSGEEAAALRRLVPPEHAHRVLFVGSRPQREVAERLGRARISVLPTLTSEGHPKGVIEAMACGTPVVCSRVPGLEGLVEDGRTGLLVPPGNAPALADALLRLLEDDALWTSFSMRGRARAQLFGKERILRRQVQVMRILAGAQAAGE